MKKHDELILVIEIVILIEDSGVDRVHPNMKWSKVLIHLKNYIKDHIQAIEK
jgi:hypothetical protein